MQRQVEVEVASSVMHLLAQFGKLVSSAGWQLFRGMPQLGNILMAFVDRS